MLDVVGRNQELAALEAFLDRTSGRSTLVLEGEAGIGKSTLWLAGVEKARARGLRVLESRPTETERGLAYTGLGDLFEPAVDEVLSELATPRRRALGIALAREDQPDDPVDPRTLAIAVRNTIELLAAGGPLLVAVDDVQWLDASSAGALGFALRRLRDENVFVLFARRLGEAIEAPDLDNAVGVERVHVGPLSLGATQRLVQARLGKTFGRTTMIRVHAASAGNPFYALELARALAAHGAVGDPTRPLPVPDTLEGLVRARLEGLPDATREALVLVAANGRASPALLRAAGVCEEPLDAALDARVIEVNGTLRFTHPLLASVLYQSLSAAERRTAHRRLADVITERVARARHLALATDQPDAAIASALEAAAQHASARGATAAAAELGEHALRLTPPAARDDRHRRALAAARAHLAAGEVERARRLTLELVAASPDGPPRAEALLVLADAEKANIHESIALRREALQHAAGQPATEASIHRGLAMYVRFTEGMAAGEKHARAAVELAERASDDGVRAAALASLALNRFNPGKADAGRLAEQAYELALASDDAEQLVAASMCLGHVRLWSMQLDPARSLLDRVLREFGDSDERTAANASWYLSLVELRAGRWAAARDYADRARELHTLYGRDDEEHPTNLFPLALIAAHRGDLDAARELAVHGHHLAESQGALLAGLEATTGLIDLWSGDPAAAVERFAHAERTAAKAGWNDPCLCWWRSENAEALLELGRVDDALEALQAFETYATRLHRTWALAYASRCRGLAAAARGHIDAAVTLLEEAVAQHEAAGDLFGRARSLLALGVVRRRGRLKRAARDAIEAALAAFDELGAGSWAEKARGELGKISGRRRDEGLTPAEQRVAALVAEGRTNREVAATLFLGERTVESHLTRVYSKLGVRSRAELASKFRGSHDFKESPPS
jgi:DNA-binding CsgD family transcriptional regulator